jgi:hypothetical protein
MVGEGECARREGALSGSGHTPGSCGLTGHRIESRVQAGES